MRRALARLMVAGGHYFLLDGKMKKHTTIEKRLGETPLEALGRIRERDSIPKSIPLAYAGRLDPMACGKLLVLIGDECKRQSHYHALDKQYRFEILLGFASDTGDLLGIAERGDTTRTVTKDSIHKTIASLVGEILLPYPVYSSKTVRGKPLFLWALEKRLNEIEVPVATTQIHTLTYESMHTVTSAELLLSIQKKINAITPVTLPSKALGEDFRRVAILAKWQSLLAQPIVEEFQILTFSTTCSSGTYIRSLAPHIATLFGTAGLAHSIHRTKIGHYHALPLIKKGFWFPSY